MPEVKQNEIAEAFHEKVYYSTVFGYVSHECEDEDEVSFVVFPAFSGTFVHAGNKTIFITPYGRTEAVCDEDESYSVRKGRKIAYMKMLKLISQAEVKRLREI